VQFYKEFYKTTINAATEGRRERGGGERERSVTRVDSKSEHETREKKYSSAAVSSSIKIVIKEGFSLQRLFTLLSIIGQPGREQSGGGRERARKKKEKEPTCARDERTNERRTEVLRPGAPR